MALAPDALSLFTPQIYPSVAELRFCLVEPASAEIPFSSHPDLYMKQVQEDEKLSEVGNREVTEIGLPCAQLP